MNFDKIFNTIKDLYYSYFNIGDFFNAVFVLLGSVYQKVSIYVGAHVTLFWKNKLFPFLLYCEEWLNWYNEKEEEFMEDLMMDLFEWCWNLKTDFAVFTTMHFTGFTVDDFRFFKHHWDEPWAVNTQWWYEDVCLWVQNICFVLTNFVEYHIQPVINDFCQDYYIPTEYLENWLYLFIFFLICYVCCDYIVDFFNFHKYLVYFEELQLFAMDEYFKKKKILYKKTKVTDPFEYRTYGSWGFDKEKFIETLLMEEAVKEKFKKRMQDTSAIFNTEAAKYLKKYFGLKQADYKGSNLLHKWAYITDAIYMFDLVSSREVAFWMRVREVFNLPHNLYKLTRLFVWAVKIFLASTWPTKWTHDTVDYGMVIDLHDVPIFRENFKIFFNRVVTNYVYDFYVKHYNEPTIDVEVLINRYADYKLWSVWHYKKFIAKEVKDEFVFFVVIRVMLVLDLLEVSYPSLRFWRNLDYIFVNWFRGFFLYFYRVFLKILQIPFLEELAFYLVKNGYARVVSVQEEASCFGYIPENARHDILGYIKYLNENKIEHYFRVAFYKGGVKLTYRKWLSEVFRQFLQTDVFGIRYAGLYPMWIKRYDKAFYLKRTGSYHINSVFVYFWFFFRKNVATHVKKCVSFLARYLWTWDVAVAQTIWRLLWENPVYIWCLRVFMPERFENLSMVQFKGTHLYQRNYDEYKYALNTKNRRWGELFSLFYINVIVYNYWNSAMFFFFQDPDESPYTYEEDWVELEYKDDHDNLFLTDFQLRKNWARDSGSWYALFNDDLSIGYKDDQNYDFYRYARDQLWDQPGKKKRMTFRWASYVQNTDQYIRDILSTHNKYFLWELDRGYINRDYIENPNKGLTYAETHKRLEDEYIFLLYYHVNNHLNGFFTPAVEIDDGYYHAPEDIISEWDIDTWEYNTQYAYGPYGMFADKIASILFLPFIIEARKARKDWRIPKIPHIGEYDLYKNYSYPHLMSSLIFKMDHEFQVRKQSLNKVVDNNVIASTEYDEVKDINQDFTESSKVQIVQDKVYENFKNFVSQNVEVREGFKDVLKNSYLESKYNMLRAFNHLLIGTKSYELELNRLKEDKQKLNQKYVEFLRKLDDKSFKK